MEKETDWLAIYYNRDGVADGAIVFEEMTRDEVRRECEEKLASDDRYVTYSIQGTEWVVKKHRATLTLSVEFVAPLVDRAALEAVAETLKASLLGHVRDVAAVNGANHIRALLENYGIPQCVIDSGVLPHDLIEVVAEWH